MQRSTVRCTDPARTRRRPWALPLAAATLALCTTGALQAQVDQYSFSYSKRLLTQSILQADEDAAFEPITGGTVLADGTQAAVAGGTVKGIGYTSYNATPGPVSHKGNATFVGNYNLSGDGSDAEYQQAGNPVLKTGPGYPIGFNFTFNGQTFDRVGISGQGWISFGQSSDGSSAVSAFTSGTNNANNTPLYNITALNNDKRRNRVVATGTQGGTTGANMIVPYLYYASNPDLPGAELRYETIGTAPNRVFVVQWLNYGTPFSYSNYSPVNFAVMDFQIRLYETSNNVEVRFGRCTGGTTNPTIQVGLTGNTGGNGPTGQFQAISLYDNAIGKRTWPYTWNRPGTVFLNRLDWANDQVTYYGYDKTQVNFYADNLKIWSSSAGTDPGSGLNLSQINNSYANVTLGRVQTPDMMSFVWAPPTCLKAQSGLSATAGLTSVTLNWTGTGDFDYAIGTGNDPSTATFTGTVTGNSVNVPGLAQGTTYTAWVRTNCGGGNTSLWTAVSFFTLPCPVPGSLSNGVMPITSVQVADINNPSTNTTSTYEDFTSVVGHVQSPLSFPITVVATNPYSNMYATAYFDWDQDGVFEDAQTIGYSTTNPATFTGTINVAASALAGNCRMRIVTSYYQQPVDACAGPTYGGQTEDYTLNVTPATCIPPNPASLAITNIGPHSANLAWAASSGGNIVGYIWEVRSGGNPGDPSPAASGTTAAGVTTASASGLASNTNFTLYVRSDCGATDGQSVWMSKPFTTLLGCGDTWISPGGVANLTDVQFADTITVCPEVAGDVVTIDFTTWNGLNWNLPQASGIFIYDGDDTNAPMIAGPGTGYTSGTWIVPAGGWTSSNTSNKPPTTTSTAASGCLTVVVMSYGSWTSGMGWSADFTCAPRPTCFAPTDRTVTATQVHGATFTWNAGASPNVEWIVVANGGTPASPVLATGTSASGTATATGLTANTEYTAFFRGLCDDQGVGDDPSTWSGSGLNFRTQVGCGGGYDLFPTTAYAGYPANTDSTITICPDNAGDVVTLTMTKFLFGWADQGLVGLFVHNGPTTGAPIFNSGQPAKTSGANTLPAGAYWGNAYSIPGGVIPGPFTSTDPSGCLTLHFRSWSTATYDTGMESDITCGPAPACSTPDNVAISNIGSTTATISWGNASGTCIVEYGPTGFTPGTGATAGTNGTVVSGLTSPANLSGLSAITNYDVYVRQVCDGPSYSANSFKAWFSTSMDCGTAIDISCGINQVQAFDGSTGDAAYHSSKFTGAPTCFTGYGAGVSGQTFLYKLTAAISGDYQLNFTRTSGTGDEYFLTAPVEDGCAAPAFTCIGGSYYIQEQTYATSHATGSYTFHLDAGDHYILMKGNPSVKTVSFNVLCPGIPICAANPTFPANGTSLAITSTPVAFSWPAVFGATGYDVYFMGNLVASNYPNTTISDNAYTTANMAALYGGPGAGITWRVVPRNSYGTASCPTNWTFTVGGNGLSNAIPLTEGVAAAGTNRNENGYTSTYSTLVSSSWFGNIYSDGNDVTYTLTTTPCADTIVVQYCQSAYVGVNNAVLAVRNSAGVEIGKLVGGALTGPDNCKTLKLAVDPETQYYVTVDAQTNAYYDFTVSYVEQTSSPDSDEDGILDCADSCPFTPGQEGDVCDAGPGFTTGRIIGCECVGGNMAVISITTDADPGQLTWEVTNESSQVVASGAPTQANTTENSTVFLAGTCYGFAVYDSNGDGIANGGWELRTTDGKVILRDEFSTGSSSPVNPPLSGSYGNYHSFCLPLAAPDVHPAECGVFDNRSDNKVFANKVAGTNYQGGTLNYQFEFSDPDSGYVRRIKKPRNYVVFSELNPSPLKGGKHYFTRVRTDKAGPVADAHWGAGCEMGLGTTVNCTQLIEAPTYGHSCNETRRYGPSSFIYAQPVFGASQYEFRIFNTGEGYDETYVRNTYILELNGFANPLLDGFSYQVQVRAKVSDTWGSYCGTCAITIDNQQQMLGQHVVQAAGEATLWPNPVRDGQVYLNIDGIEAATQQITVDVKDIYGQQVYGQAFGNSGERFSTVLNLPADIASGVYMVNITVNGEVTTHRLSIVR